MKAVYFDFWGMGGSRFSDAKEYRNCSLSGLEAWREGGQYGKV